VSPLAVDSVWRRWQHTYGDGRNETGLHAAVAS
jgi:hypothetical protein